MSLDRQRLSSYVHDMIQREQQSLRADGIEGLLERGRQWKLGDTLRAGGSAIFPHAGLPECGHQIAAVVQSCFDSGAERVLAVGVLHALTDELQSARVRVAAGADVTKEKYWGIQGPGLGGHDNWRNEFSLINFMILWEADARRRGGSAPELIVRYPYLAGGKPEMLPGIHELEQIVKDGAVVVSTADAFHHGIGYGDPPEHALYPEQGGLAEARRRITEGLELLRKGDYWGYNQHCVDAKSDARDAGQVVRYLLGPLAGRILDLTYSDTTAMYNTPPPTWVAAALIEQVKVDA